MTTWFVNPSAKAFFVIGQMIESKILDSAMPLDGKQVQKALKGLVKGMEFDQMGSEGGQGVKAAFRDGAYKAVTEKTFREAFKMNKRPIQLIEKFTSDQLRTFIEDNMKTYKNGQAVVDPEAADKAFHATAILRSLDDLKVIVTGKGDEGLLSTYIVGRAPDGSMVGLQTGVVWT
jgi:flagellar motor protein MotB